MENRMKRRKIKPGDIFGIDLGNSKFGYCILLESGITGFFDLQTENLELDISLIVTSPILFKVPIMKYSFKNENWYFIGHSELSDQLKERVYFFKQDPFDYSICIYYEEGIEGIEIPATYEEVKTLERAAVWDPERVEDRLRDHFNGVSNMWVEQLRPTPHVS